MPSHHPALPRRHLLRLASTWPLAALVGCASPWPAMPAGPGSSSARNRLVDAATTHGLAAWRGLRDINARFSSAWPTVPMSPMSPAQPGPATGPLELRLLPGLARSAPAPTSGLLGHQHRLQADAHRLLLLGPLAVVDQASVVNWGPPETLDGQRCDQLHLDLAPGLGGGAPDKLSLYIDRERGLLRRLRVSLQALPGQSAQSAVAEMDCFDHLLLHGVLWPRRFQAPAGGLLTAAAPQTWRLTGLDVNRGYAADALAGAAFSGAAAAPAHALPNG